MKSLRVLLMANGVFSVVAGLITILFAAGLADYMSISTLTLLVVGLGTTIFGTAVLWETRRAEVRLGFGLLVIAADVSWVVGAVVLVAIPGTMLNKWLLVSVSLVVALFATLQSRGVVRASEERPRRLVAEVSIAAAPDIVWGLLTDLESFAGWNPFMIEASGRVVVGSGLKVRMQQPQGSAMTFNPTVTEVREPERFEWLGSLMVAGLFDGRHRFELEPTPAGTHLVQSEEFTGLLVPLLWRSLDSKTRAGFEAMNEGLKTRAEGSVRNSI